jgi:tetratricopeptide (TPR) repeat protein
MLNYRTFLTAGAIAIASTVALGAAANATVIQAAGSNDPVRTTAVRIADASETPTVHNSKAETELLAVLADRERKLGKDNPLTLATMNALGLIYKHQGRYQEAEALYTRALESSQRALGNEHPLTASIGQNLAAIQKAQSGPAKASPHL